MEIRINGTVISLKRGDITREETDAVVNAANSRLAGGGGVDGAIHRAGGPDIMAECRKIGRLNPGGAVMTTGGRLKARYVIHTVGPIYKDGRQGEDLVLQSAYEETLKLASERGIETIAFPSISTGAYGYPIEDAAKTAVKTVTDYVRNHKGFFKLVRFVLFSDNDLEVYRKALADAVDG